MRAAQPGDGVEQDDDVLTLLGQALRTLDGQFDITKKDKATGDEADTPATAQTYKDGETKTIDMPVTNTGTEPLIKVRITDVNLTGDPSVKLRNFNCLFPDGTRTHAVTNRDGSQSVAWAATFAEPPTQTFLSRVTFHCTGTLTMKAGQPMHGDKVKVDAIGLWSGKPVHSDNPYYGKPGLKPPITGDGSTAIPAPGTGQRGVPLLMASAGAAAVAYLLRRRQQARA